MLETGLTFWFLWIKGDDNGQLNAVKGGPWRCGIQKRRWQGWSGGGELITTCDSAVVNGETCGHEEEADGEPAGVCGASARAIASVVICQQRQLFIAAAVRRNWKCVFRHNMPR